MADNLDREAQEIGKWHGDSRESPAAVSTLTIVLVSVFLVALPATMHEAEHAK